MFTNSSKSRLQIEMPHWLGNKTTHYFAMWIAAMLEETLWAHFIYHSIVLGYRSQVQFNLRKHELTNLFESRTDNTAL